jgi:hypothetical protein
MFLFFSFFFWGGGGDGGAEGTSILQKIILNFARTHYLHA